MYLLTVSLWIPNSLTIPRMDIPLSLACCRKVGFRDDATTRNPPDADSNGNISITLRIPDGVRMVRGR